MNEQLAYFLGWMFSDGCIYKDHRCDSYTVKIKIHKKDEDIFKCFQGITDWRITYDGKDKQYACLRKTNKDLALKLKSLGVLERKSFENKLNLLIPKGINEKYLPIFIRGFMDGDGSYHWANKENYLLHCEMCGLCVNVFIQIQEYLTSKGIFSKLEKIIRKDSYIWKLRIRRKEDVRKFCELIFKDNLEFKLQRKYDIVKTFLDNYKPTSQIKKEKFKPIPKPSKEDLKRAMDTRKKRMELGLIQPSMKGKHHSEETKKKMSETHKKLAQLKSSELREHL